MAVAVSEAAAVAIAAAIEKQTAVMVTQNGLINTFLAANFSPTGITIPNSPVTIARVQAQNTTDMLVVMSNMLKQQQSIVASIEVMQTALAGISSQVAAGVTTAQLAAADQIYANKFQQQTTNASLQRADLPETEITDASFLESTKQRVSDTIAFKSQIFSSTLVTDQLASAVSWTATTLGNFVQASYVGQAVQNSTIFQRIKGFFIKAKEPEAEVLKGSVAAQADLRAKLLADPEPKLNTGQWF